ncbi:hypothetical protein COCCADRAFT_92972 [Bipolaris zeicola 26-R-13]|uniref:Uncharacterized protein n=1 Tax=Cochliobolus carbonum (strain 26-R-13) TaxID=930089 RepID=W6YGF7_COCC2|nr:uncharacterized protein COCCADRAFT_92972 [Bipolaris zeicola 26-R-13]EUC34604.1 hypothetical protein COCCADRAFT_92972 [Bipolaris zeicola 26-R-13]
MAVAIAELRPSGPFPKAPPATGHTSRQPGSTLPAGHARELSSSASQGLSLSTHTPTRPTLVLLQLRPREPILLAPSTIHVPLALCYLPSPPRHLRPSHPRSSTHTHTHTHTHSQPCFCRPRPGP